MGEEKSIVCARASVMYYDDLNKDWILSGSSDGVSKVHIYHHAMHNTFRVVGRKIKDHEVVINCAILKGLKYKKATPTFHQWRDNKQVYGLNFQGNQDAENFALAMLKALEVLDNGPKLPPPNACPPQPLYQVPNVPPIMDDYADMQRIRAQQQQLQQQHLQQQQQYHQQIYSQYAEMERMNPLAANHPGANGVVNQSISHPATPASVAPPTTQPSPVVGHHRTSSAPPPPISNTPVVNAPPAPPPPPPAPPVQQMNMAPPAPPIPNPPPAPVGGPPAPPAPPPPMSGSQTLPRASSNTSVGSNSETPSLGGLAAALANAKLKKTPNKNESTPEKPAASSGSGGGMASMMDEMAKTLARRRAQKEGGNSESSNKDGVDGKKNWNEKQTNGNGKANGPGSESPKMGRRQRFGSISDESVKTNGIDSCYDMERLKQEILTEMKKEINKMKLEIIDAFKMELNRR